MANLSPSVVNQPRSGIRRIMELSQTISNVLHLEVGEPLFHTPAHIVEAACLALNQGATKYTPNAGIMPLREAIAKKASKDLNIKILSDNVLVGVGGVQVINSAIRVCCEPGDEVLIPDPSWPNYQMMAVIANVRPVSYSLKFENNYQPDFDELEKLTSKRTRLIIVNSPSNPLGVVFSDKTMQEFVDFSKRHNIRLLSDEAYEKLVFDSKHVSPLPMDPDRQVISAYTFSKTYAMTGFRVGYAITDVQTIEQMKKIQEAYVSSVPGAMQMAAVSALEGPQDCVAQMRSVYEKHRRLAADILDNHNIKFFLPNGAFYMWIYANVKDSTQFAEKLVIENRVAVAPGSTFGKNGEGYIRISLASEKEVVQEGVKRLAQVIASQKT